MALVYGTSLRTKQEIKRTLKTVNEISLKNKKSTLPWWARLLISIGVQILSQLLTTLLSAITGGIGAPLAFAIQFGINAGVDLAIDLATGEDALTVGTNLLLNAVPLFLKYGRGFVGKFKQPVYRLATASEFADESKALKMTASDLAKMGTSKTVLKEPTNIGGFNFRQYTNAEQIFKKVQHYEFSQEFTRSQISKFETWQKHLNYYSKSLRYTNKVIGIINSPQYATRKALSFLFKKPINKINKQINLLINKQLKRLKEIGKFTKEVAKKSTNRIFVNSQWINSVRLYPSAFGIGYFNVLIDFQKASTNNKKPVLLFGKNAYAVSEFLASSSKGKFYIDNFSYGWVIGKFLRTNKGFQALNFIPLFPKIITPTITTISAVKRLIKTVESDFSKNPWLDGSKLSKQISSGLIAFGLNSMKFKGSGFAKNALKSATLNDPRYVLNYTGRRFNTALKKQIRKYNMKRIYKYGKIK